MLLPCNGYNPTSAADCLNCAVLREPSQVRVIARASW